MAFARRTLIFSTMAALALAGCAKDNEIDVSDGVGITASRSLCPAVGVPVNTGDITVFDPPASRDARAIDVTAAITNVRPSCNDAGAQIYELATFDVVATRRDPGPARRVELPYYSVVMQGATQVVAKRLGTVVLTFAQGQRRARATAQASAYVNRAAATLPQDVRDRLTRRRKAGDAEAAVDPMSDPAVREAVARSTFELLIGFQLTDAQLQYNVTR